MIKALMVKQHTNILAIWHCSQKIEVMYKILPHSNPEYTHLLCSYSNFEMTVADTSNLCEKAAVDAAYWVTEWFCPVQAALQGLRSVFHASNTFQISSVFKKSKVVSWSWWSQDD